MVTELVRRAAAAGGDTPGEDFDPERWWTKHGDGRPLGYSGLLETLAPGSAAARHALLTGFFEPTEEDREEGRKVPGPAHGQWPTWWRSAPCGSS